MPSEEFDKKVKDAAEAHQPAFDEKAWLKMHKMLDVEMPEEEKRKRRFFILLFTVGLLLVGSWLMWQRPWSEKSLATNTTTRPVPAVQPPAPSHQVPLTTQGDQPVVAVPNHDAKTQTVSNNLPHVVNPARTVKDQIVTRENHPVQNTITKQAIRLPVNTKRNSQKNSLAGIDQPQKESNNSKRIKAQQLVKDNTKEKLGDIANSNNRIAGNETKNTNIVTPTTTGVDKSNSIALNEEKKVSTTNATEKKDAVMVANGDSVQQTLNNAVVEKVKTKTVFKKQSPGKLFLTVSAGPDKSQVGSGTGKIKTAYGAGITYAFRRVRLSTGLYVAQKIYSAGPNDYKLKYTIPNWIFTGANANCKVMEIPLNLDYILKQNKKSNWFAGLGLSTYLMKDEKYALNYKLASGQAYTYPYHVSGKNKYYFSILDISAGYARQLTPAISVIARPYAKIPLTGIGEGKVHLNSMGVLFTVAVRLIK